jgi:hypothetical protein
MNDTKMMLLGLLGLFVLLATILLSARLASKYIPEPWLITGFIGFAMLAITCMAALMMWGWDDKARRRAEHESKIEQTNPTTTPSP